jgi:DNA-binding response OmpR family regulator
MYIFRNRAQNSLEVSNTYLSLKPLYISSFLKTKEDRVTQRKTRIFLVDDERDILIFYKRGLEQNGFLVDAFSDPVEALLAFKASKYDLVILDIKMPRMNGFELHREIQKIDGEVKVCFITAFVAYYESLKEIFDMPNIHCIIKKPIDIRNLIEIIMDELTREPTRHIMYPR